MVVGVGRWGQLCELAANNSCCPSCFIALVDHLYSVEMHLLQ